MRKALIIARREYRAMVATKTFLIVLVMMPLLTGGGIFLQHSLQRRVNLDEKRIVVLDRTGELFSALSKAAETRNQQAIFDPATLVQIKPPYCLEQGPDGPVTDQERLQLSEQVRRGEIRAFVEIPKGIFAVPPSDDSKASMYAQNMAFSEEKAWLQQALTAAVRRHRLQEAQDRSRSRGSGQHADHCRRLWAVRAGERRWGQAGRGQESGTGHLSPHGHHDVDVHGHRAGRPTDD